MKILNLIAIAVVTLFLITYSYVLHTTENITLLSAHLAIIGAMILVIGVLINNIKNLTK